MKQSEDLTSAMVECLKGGNGEADNYSNRASLHALAVVRAVHLGDYLTFFRSYVDAPHLSAYLMDFLVQRMRIVAFKRMKVTYLELDLSFVESTLCFMDFSECLNFVNEMGGVVEDGMWYPKKVL